MTMDHDDDDDDTAAKRSFDKCLSLYKQTTLIIIMFIILQHEYDYDHDDIIPRNARLLSGLSLSLITASITYIQPIFLLRDRLALMPVSSPP